MTELAGFLETYVNTQMIRIIISGPRKKEGPSKIQIRPLSLKGEIKFQETQTVGQKELHKNYEQNEIIQRMLEWMEHSFKQLQLEGQDIDATVLISKKGKATIKIKKSRTPKEFVPMLAHNRKKKYLLEEGRPVPFLIDLGVTILDFGCGKSYLTFAMYHYLHELKHYDVHIIGLDLKTDVIEKCNRLADKYGYEKLNFYQGDIASYEGCEQVDMVVTLHACDTATDYALEKAVRWNASVILSVPCCQHELNRQIKNETLAPILEYGILKERFSAILTDGLRAQMLESKGYDTQILEFIDMEHTPKNLLIRAVKNENKKYSEQQKAAWEACIEAFHVKPTLQKELFLEGNHK